MSGPFPVRVADVIVRTSIANRGARIGVAVSGGADSVALLSVLVELRERFAYRLSVLHVNHGLRGADSDLDEEFVRGLARQYDLPVFVQQAPRTGADNAQQPTLAGGGTTQQPALVGGGNTQQPELVAGGNVEQIARDARRAFFARLIADGCVDRVALAHTLSDQAETLLLRLFRGTGISGLAGMRLASDEKLVRPFLPFTREEVRDYATEQGLRWREDSSNDDFRFRRNLLRHEIMPRLREAFHPHVERVLANTALLAQAEEDYWEQEAQRLFSELAEDSPAHGWLLDAEALRRLPLAAARRVVRVAIARVKANLRAIDGAHVDAILALCADVEGHSRVQVPGVDALRSFDRLRLRTTGAEHVPEKRHYSVAIQWGVCATLPFHSGDLTIEAAPHPCTAKSSESDAGGVTALPAGRGFASPSTPTQRSEPRVSASGFGQHLSRVQARAAPPRDAERVWLNAKLLELADEQGVCRLTVRNWEPGDSYVPLGHSAPVKIKELFQERRVYLWERPHWPVLEGGGRILWSRLFGPAADIAALECPGAVAHLTYYR